MGDDYLEIKRKRFFARDPGDRIATWLHDENELRTVEQIAEATKLPVPEVEHHLQVFVKSGAVHREDNLYEWDGLY